MKIDKKNELSNNIKNDLCREPSCTVQKISINLPQDLSKGMEKVELIQRTLKNWTTLNYDRTISSKIRTKSKMESIHCLIEQLGLEAGVDAQRLSEIRQGGEGYSNPSLLLEYYGAHFHSEFGDLLLALQTSDEIDSRLRIAIPKHIEELGI